MGLFRWVRRQLDETRESVKLAAEREARFVETQQRLREAVDESRAVTRQAEKRSAELRERLSVKLGVDTSQLDRHLKRVGVDIDKTIADLNATIARAMAVPAIAAGPVPEQTTCPEDLPVISTEEARDDLVRLLDELAE